LSGKENALTTPYYNEIDHNHYSYNDCFMNGETYDVPHMESGMHFDILNVLISKYCLINYITYSKSTEYNSI